jgi:ParB family chromosome partitioning protein
MKARYHHLPIEYLQRGRYQPREQFEQQALDELAQSIQEHGLLEPLLVRQLHEHCYEIIAGERRWRAAMLAQLSDVPCLIGEYTDQQAATLSIIENIQRQNLNLMEETLAYQRLRTEFNFSQDDIAKLVGKSRSHIANLLRLLNLSPLVQENIKNNALSLGHARLLVGLSCLEQAQLTRQIISQHWSVRQLEKKMRAAKSQTPSTPKSNDQTVLEQQLAEKWGTPVEIVGDEGSGGWLKIKFFDAETLTGLLEQLGFSYD